MQYDYRSHRRTTSRAWPSWLRYLWLGLALIIVVVVVRHRWSKALPTAPAYKPLPGGYVVFISPGGGGDELNNQYPGSGKADVTGKVVNLKLAKVLRDVLAKEGVDAVLSRETDDTFVDAVDRGQKASTVKANLSLALYTGSADNDQARGWELIDYRRPDWDDNYKQRVAFSRQLEQSINQRVGKSVMPEQGLSTRISVLTPDMPTVVLVWGQLTNQADRTLMQSDDYLYTLANGITDAIVEYRDRISKLTQPPANLAPEDISPATFAPF